MKNEVKHIYETYFSEESTLIHSCGNSEHIVALAEFLNRLVQFNHPDAFAKIGNEVLILEHFEFDSSKNSKGKGSQQRRSEADDDRAFDALVPTETGAVYHGVIEADYSIENYKDNFLRIFEDHYKEIPEYKKTLREKGVITEEDAVKTLFFIEDTTELGNIYEPDNEDVPWKPVVLPLCDFFLELFENRPELDMAICASWYPSKHCLWFIDRSMIDNCKQNAVDTSAIQLVNFTPQHGGFKLLIPYSAGENSDNA